MAIALQAGDTVQLKSGGPYMTVDALWGDGEVKCAWFAGDKQQAHNFRETSLVKVDD